MRSFVLSCLLILLVIGAAIGNSLWVDRETAGLLALCAEPAPFREKWENDFPVLLFSTTASQRSVVEVALSELEAAEKAGSTPDILLASARLREAVLSIRATELFSLRAIF